MLVYLLNEKDWLKKQYPEKSQQIEDAISASRYMSIVGDLANTVKHKELTRPPRSTVDQTDCYGIVTVSGGAGRRMYYFLENGKPIEMMDILSNGITEFEQLRLRLLSDSLHDN